jgi:hypothetical protein
MEHPDNILDLSSWFILRMASTDTIKVVDYLCKRGFSAWTPIQNKRGKRPRSRTAFDKRLAMMPSYAFANVHDLPEIGRIASMVSADTPRFTLFRTADGALPLLKDGTLDGLRFQEEKLQRQYEVAVAKGKPSPKLAEGYTAVLRGGGFDGLEATVIEQKGEFALVDIPGFHKPIKVASLLLFNENADAAKAA